MIPAPSPIWRVEVKGKERCPHLCKGTSVTVRLYQLLHVTAPVPTVHCLIWAIQVVLNASQQQGRREAGMATSVAGMG